MNEPYEPVHVSMPDAAWTCLRDELTLTADYGQPLAPAAARRLIAEIDQMRRAERYHVAVITRLTDRVAEARDELDAQRAANRDLRAQAAAGEPGP